MSDTLQHSALRPILGPAVRELLHYMATTQASRGNFPAARVRRALRPICRAARERGMLAEQLVLLCKEEWRSLPESLRMERGASEQTIAAAITLCIEEYYDGADDLGAHRTRLRGRESSSESAAFREQRLEDHP
jgi:hypothetical protein